MQTAATTQYQYGTLTEFMDARDTDPENIEHFEAFEKELYAMLSQLVMDSDSGFTAEAQHWFPRLKEGCRISLTLVEYWFSHLSVREQEIVCLARFAWI